MVITINRAKALCTSSELDLVHWSKSPRASELTPARLKQKIDRARKLRDKQRDLADRQRREARGKQGPRGKRPSKGNDTTREKQQLFQETLERFEAAMAKRRAAAEKAATKKVSKKKASKKKTSKKVAKKQTLTVKALMKKVSKKTSKKKASKKKVSKARSPGANERGRAASMREMSESTQGKRTEKRLGRAGKAKIQGHVSSRTRRNQAKRDARG
jgi:hypothetical protein